MLRLVRQKVSFSRKIIKDDSHNIYYGALTLSRWASEYGVNLMNASENEIGLVFSSYNAGRKLSQIGPYGFIPIYELTAKQTAWPKPRCKP